jgi:hypothetical protein
MKNLGKLATTLTTGLLALGLAAADLQADEPTWFGQTADGRWIVGLKTGKVRNSEPGISDATARTLVAGYEFARPITYGGTASLELEFGSSTDSGRVRPDSLFDTTGRWDVRHTGVFLGWRTPGTVYFKGKLGIVDSTVRYKLPGGTVKEQDTSVGFGAGLGVHIGRNGMIEAEFLGTTGSNDIEFLTIGGQLAF